MKKNLIQSIGSIIIVIVLVLMMFLSFYSTIPKILQKLNISSEAINEFFQIYDNPYIDINFAEKYPFSSEYKSTEANTNIVKKYQKTINSVRDGLEKYTSKTLPGYETMIELSYIYPKLMHFSLVSNNTDDRIMLEDGYYTTINTKQDVAGCASRLIQFNQYLKDNNINFTYIQAPVKVSETQTFSTIYKDYTNDNMNRLLKQISNDVPYIDLRENIKEQKMDHLKLFYKTDHHWLPETGLWVAQEISKYLNSNFDMNMEIDNLNQQNFNYKVYEKMFLGTDGKYVSLANAQPEDFSLITPKFLTSLTVNIPDLQFNKTDTYENTLIDWSKVRYTNFYKISQYATYAYGDRALIEIHNNNINNGKKVLIIKDSFSDVVVPFLALDNEYLSVIDLRKFNGSLKTYIKEYEPNVVLVMYYGTMVQNLENTTSDDVQKVWNFE